jgi:hypothetical protein
VRPQNSHLSSLPAADIRTTYGCTNRTIGKKTETIGSDAVEAAYEEVVILFFLRNALPQEFDSCALFCWFYKLESCRNYAYNLPDGGLIKSKII